jgi:toxin YoeB
MKKIWHDSAWAEYIYWQTEDKKTLKKINSLVRDIERAGGKGLGHIEQLRGNLSGCSSVKIDAKNRLVFRIRQVGKETILEIIQCKGHYSDK